MKRYRWDLKVLQGFTATENWLQGKIVSLTICRTYFLQMDKYKIAVVPGDDIGKDIVPAALEVID